MSLISQLADAITRQEGRTQNNNPGNIWDGGVNRTFPNLPTDSRGFVIYPTLEDGRAALEHDLSIKVNRGMSLQSLITMYAPPSSNDTAAYIRNVSEWTGLPTDVPLNQVGEASGGQDLGFSLDSVLASVLPSGDDSGYEVAGISGGLLVGLIVGGIALFLIARD